MKCFMETVPIQKISSQFCYYFMKTFIYSYLFLVGLSLALATDTLAQNPIICNQFTADPSARVFNGKVYLYPSHDIPPESENARKIGFVWKIIMFFFRQSG